MHRANVSRRDWFGRVQWAAHTRQSNPVVVLGNRNRNSTLIMAMLITISSRPIALALSMSAAGFSASIARLCPDLDYENKVALTIQCNSEAIVPKSLFSVHVDY